LRWENIENASLLEKFKDQIGLQFEETKNITALTDCVDKINLSPK
jgi:hypothetical protein